MHGAPATAPATTPSASTPEARLQTFAAVTIPAGARDLVVMSAPNRDGQLVYTSRFATTPDGARAFCAANGLGGQLPWLDGLGSDTRAYYGVTGDSVQRPFSCRSSSPQDPQVQREVFVTLPAKDIASVHLVAYRMPR